MNNSGKQTAFTRRMTTEDPAAREIAPSQTSAMTYVKNEIKNLLAVIGPSPAVARFADSYSSVKTKRTYLQILWVYLRWLREEIRIEMTPDQLLKDNLECIFNSDATDVITKRKHLDWLSSYVNRHMVDRGLAQGTREVHAAVISQFYAKNDSPLWGHFEVSREAAVAPAPPLDSKDIREVLKSLPLNIRVPLLLEWQSGVEIDRVLALRWRDVFVGLEGNSSPIKLTFYGRKKHRKEYSPLLGQDSVKHLRQWRSVWTERVGRQPAPDDMIFLGKSKNGAGPRPMTIKWLNDCLKAAASRLSSQGLIENGDPASWHSHYLRHQLLDRVQPCWSQARGTRVLDGAPLGNLLGLPAPRAA
jgi:integrase